MKKNIVIVGAGITGLSAGLQLLRGGLEVTLIDRVDIGSEKQTSYGNAGLLAASSIIPLSSPGLVKNLPFYLKNCILVNILYYMFYFFLITIYILD